MAYQTGTINTGTINAEQAVLNWMKPTLESAGWTTVESFSSQRFPNATTFVFKQPNKPHVAIVYANRVDATMLFTLAADYDSSTKVATGVLNASGSVAHDANGRNTATLNTNTFGWDNSLFQKQVSLSTNGYTYWISASETRVAFGVRNGGTESCYYFGGFDNTPDGVTVPDKFMFSAMDSSQISYGVCEPNVSQAGTNNGYSTAVIQTYGESTATPLYGNRIPTTRLWINTARSGFGRWGVLSDVLAFPRNAAVSGDTVEIAGDTWVVMRSNSYHNTWVPIVRAI